MEKKYPMDHENGDYYHKACEGCGHSFMGGKRDRYCKLCTEDMVKADTERLNADPEDLTIEDYKNVSTDHDRLVREIDVILNGDNAAKQASLCDLVGQIKQLKEAARQGAVWVNASERLPEDKKQNYIFRQVNNIRSAKVWYLDFTPNIAAAMQLPIESIEWLDESPPKESDAVDPDELWDEFSEYIANDIDSCQEVAGTAIMTKMGFNKLMSKIRRP